MNGLNLPLLAFCLNGYEGHIKLTIDEVYGFPDETSYSGGYGAKGSIEIVAGAYRVNSQHHFTTGELHMFKESLVKCYETLSGIAVLDNAERELEMSISFSTSGKIVITGSFQERPDLGNKLEFEINSDQTFIQSVIQELTAVQRIFGDTRR